MLVFLPCPKYVTIIINYFFLFILFTSILSKFTLIRKKSYRWSWAIRVFN